LRVQGSAHVTTLLHIQPKFYDVRNAVSDIYGKPLEVKARKIK